MAPERHADAPRLCIFRHLYNAREHLGAISHVLCSSTHAGAEVPVSEVGSKLVTTTSYDGERTAAGRCPVPRGLPAAVLLRIGQLPGRVEMCALDAQTLAVPTHLYCAHCLRVLSCPLPVKPPAPNGVRGSYLLAVLGERRLDERRSTSGGLDIFSWRGARGSALPLALPHPPWMASPY